MSDRDLAALYSSGHNIYGEVNAGVNPSSITSTGKAQANSILARYGLGAAGATAKPAAGVAPSGTVDTSPGAWMRKWTEMQGQDSKAKTATDNPWMAQYARMSGTVPQDTDADAGAAPVTPTATRTVATPTDDVLSAGSAEGEKSTEGAVAPEATDEEKARAAYKAWLQKNGYTLESDHAALVEGIESDYERGKSTYGAQAEAMARAGLIGSGYSEYSDALAYGNMQSLKAAALAQYQKEQAAAKAAYAGEKSATDTATSERETALYQTALGAAVNEDGTVNDMTVVQSQLKNLGYSDEEVAAAMTKVHADYTAGIQNSIATATTLSAVPTGASIQEMINKKLVDETTGAQMLADANVKRAQFITDALSSESKAVKFLQDVDPETYSAEAIEAEDFELGEALLSVATKLYENGELDQEEYIGTYLQSLENEIAEIEETEKEKDRWSQARTKREIAGKTSVVVAEYAARILNGEFGTKDTQSSLVGELAERYAGRFYFIPKPDGSTDLYFDEQVVYVRLTKPQVQAIKKLQEVRSESSN